MAPSYVCRVFITGGSSGLGAALIKHYLAQGAIVGAVARDIKRFATLSNTFAERLRIYSVDVGDAPAMQAACADFSARYGLPDLVIANAGISVGTDPALAEDLPVLERTMRTNLCGVANTFQPFIASMRERGSGKLVGIASVAGIRGLAGGGAYSASKSALITWLESARLDLYGSGVEVLTICPGYVDTPMTRVNPYRMPFILKAEEAARRIARVIAAGRRYAVVPWQMAIVAKVLRLLPRPLYDRLFARAPRKPRNLSL